MKESKDYFLGHQLFTRLERKLNILASANKNVPDYNLGEVKKFKTLEIEPKRPYWSTPGPPPRPGMDPF